MGIYSGSFDALVIFTKVPRPRQVKSRLGKKIGYPEAAKLYGSFLKYLSWQFRKLPIGLRLWVAVSPARSRREMRRHLPFSKGCVFFGQRGKDLGERLLHANRFVQKRGGRKVLLIGSDCLELTPGHLEQARDLLERKDLVLGPARDGGYYLIAWKKPLPTCLRGVAWGGGEVFSKTLRNARQGGYSVGILDPLSDVDEWEDLKGVPSKLNPRNPFTAPLRNRIERLAWQ